MSKEKGAVTEHKLTSKEKKEFLLWQQCLIQGYLQMVDAKRRLALNTIGIDYLCSQGRHDAYIR